MWDPLDVLERAIKFIVNLAIKLECPTVYRKMMHISMVKAKLWILFAFFCRLFIDMCKLDHVIFNPLGKNEHHFFHRKSNEGGSSKTFSSCFFCLLSLTTDVVDTVRD